MTEQAVRFEIDGPIARLTIDRPDRRNAINADVVAGLLAGLAEAEANDALKVVVLTGSGEKAFCAGGDLGGMTAEGPIARHLERARVGDLLEKMRASRLPIVARVNGHALAGGFGLMLGCDLVVVADHAELGMPEVNIGLWPFMITAIVNKDVPRKLAMELMLTGRRMSAQEALSRGIVNAVVEGAELDAAVDELANEVAGKSPLIVQLGKGSFYAAEDMSTADALDYLAGMLTLCLSSEDTIEGVTAFIQKRPPQWKGR